MDGLRVDTTGEVELELSKEESVILYSAVLTLLHEDWLTVDARMHLQNIVHCMRQLGVEV